jgi:acetyl esterase/lipase
VLRWEGYNICSFLRLKSDFKLGCTEEATSPIGDNMSVRHEIDPESLDGLTAFLEFLPGGFGAIADLEDRRAALQAVMTAEPLPENPNVQIENRIIVGPVDNPELGVRIYRPSDSGSDHPAIVMIHGGGMIMGSAEGEDVTATALCESIGAVVVSVDYRLAPENPHPAPVEDCYAAWTWVTSHTDELGIDSARIALYGESAGGGLALGTALMVRDRGGVTPTLVAAIYPMLDDSNSTPSSHEVIDVGVWDRAVHIEAWNLYLGGSDVDHYAAPARATDLSGLAPTYMDVGTVDLLRDETVQFAQRLLAAGVPCELHVWPGAYHGSEFFAAEAPLSQRIVYERLSALRRALVR